MDRYRYRYRHRHRHRYRYRYIDIYIICIYFQLFIYVCILFISFYMYVYTDEWACKNMYIHVHKYTEVYTHLAPLWLLHADTSGNGLTKVVSSALRQALLPAHSAAGPNGDNFPSCCGPPLTNQADVEEGAETLGPLAQSWLNSARLLKA